MNVSVVDLDTNQKKLQVEIPARQVQEKLDSKYKELGKQARIKGFRPGKVPRSILKSYYGKSIEGEVSSEIIQTTFPDAVKEAELKPLAEADVSEARFQEDGTFVYSAVIEVCPPFEVEDYLGMKLTRPAAEVADDEVEAELERVREQHGKLTTIEEERPINEGDHILIDFMPSVDGKAFDRGKTTDYMLEVGKNNLHPEFDGHLVGHKPGESFSFDLEYPEDAPTAEIAGKMVHFDLTIKEIKEKILPDLDDEFAKSASDSESLEDMREKIRGDLLKKKEEAISRLTRQQISDKLLEMVQFELSPRVIEREVDRQIGNLQQQFKSQGLDVDVSRFDTPEIRAEYRVSAEKSLRQRLILDQIAAREEVGVTDGEMEEIYNRIATYARMDPDTVRSDFADNPIVEQAREDKIRENVLSMLELKAEYTEPLEETPVENQE